MEGQFLTDTGQVRKHNEDSGGIYYNSSDQFLAVIADGMGGHQAGDVASQMATSKLKEKWEECQELKSPEETEDWLSQTIIELNKSIYNHAQENQECFGMGTTIVVVICIQDFVTVAHTGDSRCYILSDNGFDQITEDHSLVNALIQSGQISKNDAQSHPRKNVVLKALGTEEQIDSDVQTLNPGQSYKILLCTDGLTDKVLDGELSEIIQSTDTIQEIGGKMINLANERGGEDNISLVILHHDVLEKEGGE